MPTERTSRRTVLRTSGAALLSAVSAAGAAGAREEPIGSGGVTARTGIATVSGTHVTTHGEVTSDYEDQFAHWFEWGPEGAGLPNTTYYVFGPGGWVCDGYDSSCANDSYGSLSSGTYEYRVAASSDNEEARGTIRTFTI